MSLQSVAELVLWPKRPVPSLSGIRTHNVSGDRH